MRKMHVIYSVISIILLMLCACSQNQDAEDSGWQGRVEEKDGITEILNPENPVYGSLDLDLEENLILGSDDDDNFMFFNVNGSRKIHLFNQDGEFLKNINLSLLITNFCITPDNNIFGVAMNSTAEGRILPLQNQSRGETRLSHKKGGGLSPYQSKRKG